MFNSILNISQVFPKGLFLRYVGVIWNRNVRLELRAKCIPNLHGLYDKPPDFFTSAPRFCSAFL